jgi:hypothetical protein
MRAETCTRLETEPQRVGRVNISELKQVTFLTTRTSTESKVDVFLPITALDPVLDQFDWSIPVQDQTIMHG